MDEQEFAVKVSPIKFTVEKDGIEYEFSPIGEVTDLVKLRNDVIDIMKRFNINIKSKNIVVIPESKTSIRHSFEEEYLKAKETIREWYREDPEKGWTANDLMEAVKFQKIRRSAIMTKLLKENFIRCVNPSGSRNERRYVKAEAMIIPEPAERNMEKLQEERKSFADQLG